MALLLKLSRLIVLLALFLLFLSLTTLVAKTYAACATIGNSCSTSRDCQNASTECGVVSCNKSTNKCSPTSTQSTLEVSRPSFDKDDSDYIRLSNVEANKTYVFEIADVSGSEVIASYSVVTDANKGCAPSSKKDSKNASVWGNLNCNGGFVDVGITPGNISNDFFPDPDTSFLARIKGTNLSALINVTGKPPSPPISPEDSPSCKKEGETYTETETGAACCRGLEPRQTNLNQVPAKYACVDPAKNPLPIVNEPSTPPIVGEEFTVKIDKCIAPMNIYCEGPADNIPHTFLDRKKCAVSTERIDNQTTSATFQFDKAGRFSFMADCAGNIAISGDILIKEASTDKNTNISCLKCSPEFPYLDSYTKCDLASKTCPRVDTCSKVRIITRAMIDQDSKVFEAPTEELCPAASCTPGKGCNFEYPDAGTPPCIEGLDSKGNPVIVKMEWFDSSGRVLDDFKDEAKNKSASIVLCTKTNTAVGAIETRPAGLVRSLLGILLSISGMIALYFIIRSGYQLMTSRGNPETIQAAKERLTSAIVGLLFILFSLVILQVIGVDLLKIPGFGN